MTDKKLALSGAAGKSDRPSGAQGGNLLSNREPLDGSQSDEDAK